MVTELGFNPPQAWAYPPAPAETVRFARRQPPMIPFNRNLIGGLPCQLTRQPLSNPRLLDWSTVHQQNWCVAGIDNKGASGVRSELVN